MRKTFFAMIGSALLLSPLTTTRAQTQPPSLSITSEKTDIDNITMAISSHQHDEIGSHMKFSARRTVRPGDEARAAEVVKTARRVLENYKDYQAALRGRLRDLHA